MAKRSLLRALAPQDIHAQASADGHIVIVTDDVLQVGSGDVVKLSVAIENVRRSWSSHSTSMVRLASLKKISMCRPGTDGCGMVRSPPDSRCA
jgi:hypothetical protein